VPTREKPTYTANRMPSREKCQPYAWVRWLQVELPLDSLLTSVWHKGWVGGGAAAAEVAELAGLHDDFPLMYVNAVGRCTLTPPDP
jgi:hypothetical protein